MAINTITLSGRLVADLDLRYTQKGIPVTHGSIAVKDGWGEHENTYFFPFVAWKQVALYLTQYARKGTQIWLEGKLTQDKWQDEEGLNRYKTEVLIKQVVLPPHIKTEEPAYSITETEDTLGEEITFDDDDLPF